MFTCITLENYGLFEDQSFDFTEKKGNNIYKKLVMLYGANNSGKTTFVRAFSLLVDSCQSLHKAMQMPFFMKGYLLDDMRYRDSLVPGYSRSFQIQDYINVNLANPNSSASIVYSGRIDKSVFQYTISFNSKVLTHEELLINDKVVFSVIGNSIDNTCISNHFIYSKDLSSHIEKLIHMFFGKHSVLACIDTVIQEYNLTRIKDYLSEELIKLIENIKNIHIYQNFQKDGFTITTNTFESKDLLDNVVFGKYTKRKDKKLNNTKTALSKFFANVFNYVERVEYKLKEISGETYYSLFFVEKHGGKSVWVPANKQSTGTRKLLDLFPYFYEITATPSVAIVDEIDAGINNQLLMKLFKSIENNIMGQLIITTHNNELMHYSVRRNIFLLERDANGTHVQSIDNAGYNIQPNTDIPGRFMLGTFNAYESDECPALSFVDIVNTIKSGSNEKKFDD